jgi:hypothetical protein
LFVVLPKVKLELKADLYGAAYTSGVAEGIARVVTDFSQFSEAQVGEIFVAPFAATSWNPTDTIQFTNAVYKMIKAKETGIEIISVDPRYTNSTAQYASQWIPIRPGTDPAQIGGSPRAVLANLEDRDVHTSTSL